MRLATLSSMILLAAPPAAGQYFPLQPGQQVASSSDNAAIIMKGVFGELAHQFARAGRDTTSRAVVISVPPDSAAVWEPYRAFLLHALRGRDPVDSDSMILRIALGAPTMRRDTLVADFVIGGARRCGSEWPGSSTTYQINVKRRQHDWADPYVGAYLFSDSAACGR